MGLCFVHNHNPHRTKLDPRSLRGIFLDYFRTQKGYKYFYPSIGKYILSADVNWRFSHLFLLCVEDDYLFYQETSINSGKSTYENITSKNLLRFQDLIQTYRCRTTRHVLIPTSVPSSTQQSSKTIAAQLSVTSTFDDLPIALQKEKRNCTQHPITNFVSYSHLSFFRSFISSLKTHSIRKNVSETLSISC